jgi:hypothetical protein
MLKKMFKIFKIIETHKIIYIGKKYVEYPKLYSLSYNLKSVGQFSLKFNKEILLYKNII